MLLKSNNLYKYIIYLLIIIVTIITGCEKDKPPVGKYQGSFLGTYKDSANTVSKNRYETLYIVHSDKSTIDMATCPNCTSSSLSKGKNNSISGIIEISSAYGADIGYVDDVITIEGNWGKNGDEYIITGNFSYDYKIIDGINQIEDTYVVTGEFEIKSNY